jgi:hypothetical protein
MLALHRIRGDYDTALQAHREAAQRVVEAREAWEKARAEEEQLAAEAAGYAKLLEHAEQFYGKIDGDITTSDNGKVLAIHAEV